MVFKIVQSFAGFWTFDIDIHLVSVWWAAWVNTNHSFGLFVTFRLKFEFVAPMVVVLNHGPLFTNCIASCFFCFLSLSLVGFVAPMLALLYVMFVYWFCSQLSYLFSSALFHNCLTLSFSVSVPSIFVMTLHSLTAPIIATIGLLFYVTIWVDLSFVVISKIVYNS